MNNTGENLFYFTEHSHVAAEQTGIFGLFLLEIGDSDIFEKKGSSIYDGPVCGDCGVLLHSLDIGKYDYSDLKVDTTLAFINPNKNTVG